MLFNSNACFENPEMPQWLEAAIRISFRQKNLDNIKGYIKLWEDIQNGK
jgi:hypothetical protein